MTVTDWFSHSVISEERSETLELPFVSAAAERALAEATPLIWNSDQAN